MAAVWLALAADRVRIPCFAAFQLVSIARHLSKPNRSATPEAADTTPIIMLVLVTLAHHRRRDGGVGSPTSLKG